MSHYIDIHLRPDPELPSHQLMDALYAKLHRALVQLQLARVGVSFPGYQETPPALGKTLRLIGPKDTLEQLMAHAWLQGMRDHVDTREIASVPDDATHRCLRRVQAKSNPERLRRRQMRRHALNEEQARVRIPDSTAEVLRLPFVTMRSTSTGHTFPLFLQLGPPLLSAEPDGEFNSYGLSSTATIPWF
ncbi:type I-F CRISPR-associated endoribonuclease Cas6/Csy4 [Thioalkalicoccus limnaeus]|uniref:Type I-F CRISPR-associated endoribonuclease Cas6/Csy4 n=1 Tax=Thioalkalicoccus limnaeus TaxID=120681 RepID=A0ABV4B9L4_9GAMM